MLPAFLLPETEIRESGSGSLFDLGSPSSGEERPDSILVILGITHMVQHQSLDVAIEGSADGAHWLPKPLVSFSQKFYCGTYPLSLNLRQHPGIRYLRPKWTVSSWGRGAQKPQLGIYVFVHQEKMAAVLARGAA